MLYFIDMIKGRSGSCGNALNLFNFLYTLSLIYMNYGQRKAKLSVAVAAPLRHFASAFGGQELDKLSQPLCKTVDSQGRSRCVLGDCGNVICTFNCKGRVEEHSHVKWDHMDVWYEHLHHHVRLNFGTFIFLIKFKLMYLYTNDTLHLTNIIYCEKFKLQCREKTHRSNKFVYMRIYSPYPS